MTESVWDYPRPPALVPCERRVRVELGAITGDFYGGWISTDLRGPFKGAPGTRTW